MIGIFLLLYLSFGRGNVVSFQYQDMESCKKHGEMFTHQITKETLGTNSEFYFPNSDGDFDCINLDTGEIFQHVYQNNHYKEFYRSNKNN